MLTQCANPDCDERFRYLGEGRLYLNNPADALDLTQQQLFERCSWLCKRCSETFELRFLLGKPTLLRRELRKAANH